ncbi:MULTISPECIES: hypothetical protein [Staphylococcus]|uniref:DUF2798 domain-containing protein n=2 Tax=Staphylococcus equorum TaxID=246432 RepID=A0AAW7AGD3_9STAP|nr:hypothetical protein [Staphylococcus equorum]MDK9866131.1 hypothetical protein [Staphylococcus equorum]
MYLEPRLPQNGREAMLFVAIISIISVNTIGPLVMGFQFGFSLDNYLMTLTKLPFIWIAVVILVIFVANPLVGKLVAKFASKDDSFNAQILFNILFNVTILSILLTIIGTWIGTGTVNLEVFETFFYNWPRNFFIAFWIELLIAQPIARFAMKTLHAKKASSEQSRYIN